MGAPRIDRIDQNLIINGNFDYWQRGTSFSTLGSYYTADRMYTARSTGTNVYSRSTDVPDSQSTYSLRIQNTSGTNPRLGQRIAADTALKYIGKTITVQIKIKVGDATATPINMTVQFPTATDNYASSTIPIDVAVNAAPTQGVWKTYRYTFVVPSDAARGMQINFIRPSVSNVTTDTYFSQFIAREGEYTEDMLFSYCSGHVDSEFPICMRYYEKSYPVATLPGTALEYVGSVHTQKSGTNGFLGNVRYNSVKIKSPVVTLYTVSSGAAGFIDENGSPVSGSADETGVVGFLGRKNAAAVDQAAYRYHWVSDAEI